jgi:hypothetical protein
MINPCDSQCQTGYIHLHPLFTLADLANYEALGAQMLIIFSGKPSIASPMLIHTSGTGTPLESRSKLGLPGKKGVLIWSMILTLYDNYMIL